MAIWQPLHAEVQVLHRILRFSSYARGLWGTCFVIDVDEEQYLITAAHLTIGERFELVILKPIPDAGGEHTKDTHPDHLERIGPLDPKHDVAVFKANDDLARRSLTLPASSDQIVIGQEILTAGFPGNLSMVIPKMGLRSMPLVKRGCMGGMGEVDGIRVLYLDLIANPGMSGAPVVFRDHEKGVLKVAAVIKGSYTQDPVPEDGWDHLAAAGISQAHAIEHALEIIASG
ncbi:S1 family peptidase [Jiangella alba]|uniref:Trypsin-like peptidase domain-containing protein n=1 Tax=Jiangella alba TaxID=561176 RepID=A0A1H5J556_9ACTN|nr:serine protease [Jiangella alba]SEE47626.1 Trypsin-like peptidase domain-containing protein [Jiangella alba]